MNEESRWMHEIHFLRRMTKVGKRIGKRKRKKEKKEKKKI